jgi:hypothetical protein
MLRRVDEPASHLTHSDQCRTRRTPRGALVERRRGQSLQRLSQAYASAVVVLGSAACTSRKPCAVRWSVTNILARAVLAGTRAQSPVRCDGLARGPSPQQRPGVGPRPPAARLAGCNPSCSCAPRGRARRALCGPRASATVGRSPGPPGRSVWALAELDPGPPMGAGGSGPPGSMQEPHHRAVACGDASGRAEIARTVTAVQMTIQRNRPVTGTMSLRSVTGTRLWRGCTG